MTTDLSKEDFYATLGVEETADKKTIIKAYRKRALKCHPDKNPDNPKAAEEFHKLSKALEILTDAAARAAYDKLRQAKKAAELRTKSLDSKRRKLKEDLEARESAVLLGAAERKTNYHNRTAEEKLRAEIERLRTEGSSILKQEQEAMQRQMNTGRMDSSHSRLRLKWNGKSAKQYSETDLKNIFSKHGIVVTVLISAKKAGSALLELDGSRKSYIHEIGFPENPLKIIVISSDDNQTSAAPVTSQTKTSQVLTNSSDNYHEDFEAAVLGKLLAAQKAKTNQINTAEQSDFGATLTPDEDDVAPPVIEKPAPPVIEKPAPPISARDPYESVMAMNARRAAERQRLIEEMMKEDDD